jgi:hypothetical protein
VVVPSPILWPGDGTEEEDRPAKRGLGSDRRRRQPCPRRQHCADDLAVLTIAAAAAGAAPALLIDYSNQTTPDRDIIALASALRFGLFVFGALRLAAVFMTVTSTIGQRFNALPRWLSLAGLVMAAVLFVHDPFLMLFPIWLIVVSITLLVTTRRRDRAAA